MSEEKIRLEGDGETLAEAERSLCFLCGFPIEGPFEIDAEGRKHHRDAPGGIVACDGSVR
jgi:hypothetical protein